LNDADEGKCRIWDTFCKACYVYNSGLICFLFIAGEPLTGQRMFESNEEEDADWQVSALAVGSWEKLKLICSCTAACSPRDPTFSCMLLS